MPTLSTVPRFNFYSCINWLGGAKNQNLQKPAIIFINIILLVNIICKPSIISLSQMLLLSD